MGLSHDPASAELLGSLQILQIIAHVREILMLEDLLTIGLRVDCDERHCLLREFEFCVLFH